jgi:glucokinase
MIDDLSFAEGGGLAPFAGRDAGALFPFPALLLDLSITTARARLVTEDLRGAGGTWDIDLGGFASASEVVSHLLDVIGPPRPRSLIISFPGPVLGFKARFTNSDWVVDCLELHRRFRFANGILVNDQEAAAFSIPDLGTNETIHVGSRPLPSGAGPEALISLRHGLGVASLRRFEQKYVSLASEAGHIGLSPSSADEAEVLTFLLKETGTLRAEALFYRPGLPLIHAARMKLGGGEAREKDLDAIVSAALADPESEAAQSAQLFARMVANYAGDLAITFFATGGVTISGYVLRRLAPIFQHPSVRSAFERRPPLQQMMQRVSFRLALIDDLTLRGLTVLAQNPAHFGINFENRCWRDAGI